MHLWVSGVLGPYLTKGETFKHCVLSEIIHNYVSQVNWYTLYPGIYESSGSSLLSPSSLSTEEWREVGIGNTGVC